MLTAEAKLPGNVVVVSKAVVELIIFFINNVGRCVFPKSKVFG
jgi:hypothetical protein